MSGFTVLELLVVIAILSLLIAMLIPALTRARHAARRVVCASRLRDLTQACTMYRGDNKVYPPRRKLEVAEAYALEAMTAFEPVSPLDLDPTLVNHLARYMKYPEVDDDTPASELPTAVQCPYIEDLAVDRETRLVVGPGGEQHARWYTGYGYFAGLRPQPNEEASTTTTAGVIGGLLDLQVIRPTDVPDVNGSAKTAVLWSDDVRFTPASACWRYSHASGKARAASIPLTYRNHDAAIGQHRAYTDGSVVWVPGELLSLAGAEAAAADEPGAAMNPAGMAPAGSPPANRGRKKGHRPQLEKAAVKVGGSYFWF